jgi:malonyl-CoA O-methyltransferase
MNKEKLVLLHGWGFNRFIWDPILPELNKLFETIPLDLEWDRHQGPHPGNHEAIIRDPSSTAQDAVENLCDWIAKNTPEKAIYLGWSLGGLMAMAMTARYPERVTKLISVCASPSFLKSENWPGIESAQLDLFAAQFRTDPRSWSQKFIQSQLGSVDLSKINLSRFFESKLPELETLNAGLQMLKNIDLRKELAHLKQEKLFIFGRLDRITPEKTSAALLNAKIPKLYCKTLKRAAHIPFLSHSEDFLALIRDFFGFSNSNRKLQIKKSFNEASSTYHDAARLQEECAKKLIDQLPLDFQAKNILELGCGTGLLTRLLQEKFPDAEITAIDIAEKMLRRTRRFSNTGSPAFAEDDNARENSPTSQADKLKLVCADAESLPFQDKSFDLVISNFTLQWCELSNVFRESERVLKNKGHLYFCTLGENTLIELKTSWHQVDQEAHVNEFPSSDSVLNHLKAQPFANPIILDTQAREYYEHPINVITRIKAWGAQNIHSSRPRSLCGKNKFKKFIHFYQKTFQQDTGVYASYHTLYGSAQKN